MSRTLKQVQVFVAQQNILISEHGYDELASDDIFVQDIIEGAIHVVWGIPKRDSSRAVVVTAYRPDPERWTDDFMRRRL